MTGDHAPSAELKAAGEAHAALVNVCPYCGQTHESPVFTAGKWNAWLRARARGASVQGFWSPEFSPAEREEFLISGMCDACWKRTFAETEEEG